MATKELKKVGVDTSTKDVLQFDQDGYKLQFDLKAFPYLPTAVVKELSKMNRDAYAIARTTYELENDPENGDVVDQFVVSPANQRLATTSYLKVDVKNGLTKHFTRPDNIDKNKLKGYRVATANDLKDAKRADAIHVKIGGYTDSVLMVRSEELTKKFKAEKRAYSQKLVQGKSLADGASAIDAQGLESTGAEYSRTEE